MPSIDENVRLTDLIPVETLQKIQNSFSKMARMAALTTDENGVPLTVGSNFSDLCENYCRKSPTGRKRCEQCDRNGAIKALESGHPVSYFCHAHLVDFAAPIMLGDRMIGSFVGGQVLAEEPDYDLMRATARELGLDEEAFAEAAKKTQIVPKAAIERSTNFIFEFSRVISDMAYKTYETIRLSNLAVSQKSDFLANMSHEIRTPMNAVLGMAEMALREEMTPRAKQYIRQIRSSGKHLLVIINDILDFSKIESGKLDIITADYEPLSMVNDLINIVNTRVGSKPLEFTIDLDPALPRKLHGDSVRIHQILLNLLNNAVKFTDKGEVHLAISFDRIGEDSIMLKAVVSDTGIGIKDDDMDKLFKSFQQVDSKRNRNIEGTGLGLAISKQLLKLMNGSISVESKYEKGSTFYIELPQKIVNAEPSVPAVGGDRRVLLLIENKCVYAQLCRDLDALHVEHFDISDENDADSINSGFLIVEKQCFTDRIKKTVSDNTGVKCLVIAPFDESFDIDMPRVKMLRKPIYAAGLYSALNADAKLGTAEITEKDNFVFTAPDAHILIVDDNPVNLTVACGIVEPLGMQVDTANGASETIEKVRQTKYDLIFMDHMMPEVDGVETTHIIRRLIKGYEDVPIIALTANAMGGTKEMFLREGMNDFVAKPIEVTDMVSMVRKWLPKEKIIPSEGKKAVQKEEKKMPQLVIDGLNTEHALSLLGSEKLYMQILKDYYLSVDKRASIITEALEKGDIKAYTIEVHSLKSTSKQIGADALSDLARCLEKAGNENDTAFILAKTDGLIKQYLSYKDILAPLFPELAKKPEEHTEEQSVIYELLDGAESAVKAKDPAKLNGVIKKMAKCRFTPAQTQCFKRLADSAGKNDLALCGVMVDIWRQIAAAECSEHVSSAEDIKSALGKMQNALNEFDSLLIDDAFDQISALTLPNDQAHMFLKLKKAVEESDIDLCISVVDEWMGAIKDNK